MFESTIHLVTLLGTAHAVMPSLNPLEVSNLCVWMPILFLDLVDVRDNVEALHLGPTKGEQQGQAPGALSQLTLLLTAGISTRKMVTRGRRIFPVLAPSTVADHSEVRNSSPRITNDHSRKDTPIALLYHRFGCAFDCANEGSMDPLFSPDNRQFEIGIDDFANKMSKYYPDETARRDKALGCPNAIFRCYLES